MKRLISLNSLFVKLVLLGALFTLAAFAQEQKKEQIDPVPVESLAAKIDGLFAQWDKPDSPGCALGVIKDGNFIYKRGYGMANLEHNIPISAHTSFYIGSVSKQFTAMSIALLAREGKISLDDDIRKYLPEIPQYQAPITIRHLIYHTSGIRDYGESTYLAGRDMADVYTDEEFLGLIARQKNLIFKPGEQHLYSNSGYLLLSLIVKRATGKPLRVYADEKIFKPLGMANTRFHDDRREIIKNRATGHDPRKGGGFFIVMTNFDQVGDGGLYTSVEDLLLWDRNFYDNKLGGGAGLIDQLLTPGTLNNGEKTDYAFAVRMDKYKGLEMISHGGSFIGFKAQMLRFPRQKFSVVCLCNLRTIDVTGLAKKVADIFLEGQLKPNDQTVSEAAFLKLSEKELAAFSGHYFDTATGLRFRMIVKDGKLLYVDANDTLELKPIGKDRFLVPSIPGRVEVTFSQPRPDQSTTLYWVTDGGEPEIGESYTPVTYTPDELSKFAGTFYSEELDARYVLAVKENKLTVKFGRREIQLEELFADAFSNSQDVHFVIRFNRDEQNRITGFSASTRRAKGISFGKM